MARALRLSKNIVFPILLSILLVTSNIPVHSVQPDSNVILNPSLELQLQGWGTWMKHGTPTSTISVNDTRSVSGNYSARLDMGQTGIGFVALYQLFPQNVTFGQLSDRPDSVDLWFYLKPKFDGMGDFQVKFIATSAHEVAYVFDPDPRLIYSNQTFRTDISLYNYQGDVWHHFTRNVKADWESPVRLPDGTTRPGFSSDETLYRIEIDAIGFEDPGNGTYYSETAWLDDVNVYMSLPPDLSPTARFTVTPSTPAIGTSVTFDASTSSDPDGAIAIYKWNLGDGTSTFGEQAYHIFNTTGKFNITLSVIDDRGSENTTVQSILVDGPNMPPNARFTFSPPQPAVTDAISFDATNSTDPDQGDSIQSYSWSFGDGTLGSGPIVSHNYTTPALYDISLTVTDSHGSTNTTQQSIFVTRIHYLPGVQPGQWARYIVSGNVPLASNLLLLTLNFTGVAGTNVTFTAGYEYFNSSTYLSFSQNILSFRITGLMAANLTMGDLPWANSEYTVNSTAIQTVLGATRQVNVITAPFLGGTFTGKWDQETGILLELDENFPDPSTSESKRLTIELVDSNIWIPSSNRSPVPVFTWSPFVPGVNETVSFDALRSYDPDPTDTIMSYRWDFGDGTTLDSTSATIDHTYSASGLYNVSLVAFDNNGASALSYRSLTVPLHDVAIIQVLDNPFSSIIGRAVSIQVTLSNQGDPVETVTVSVSSGTILLAPVQNVTISAGTNMILQFKWNTTGFAPGPYAILAKANIVPGETNTFNNQRQGQTVTLVLPLKVDITAVPSVGVSPLTVSFTSLVTGGTSPYTYAWVFGDGSASTAPNPVYTYSTQGTVVASLTVRDSRGIENSTTTTITVLAPLAVAITRSPEAGQAPLTVTFSAEPAGGEAPYTVSWSFGDGSFAVGRSIVHNYQSQGSYLATASVTDALGNTASSTVTTLITAVTGSLRIRVEDQSGNPIADASIFITQVPEGQEVPSVGSTLPDGTASFSNLLPGTYKFTVLAGGYEFRNQAANVTAGPQTTESVVVLAPGQQSQAPDYSFYIGLGAAVMLVVVVLFVLRRRRNV